MLTDVSSAVQRATDGLCNMLRAWLLAGPERPNGPAAPTRFLRLGALLGREHICEAQLGLRQIAIGPATLHVVGEDQASFGVTGDVLQAPRGLSHGHLGDAIGVEGD